jgi:nitrite reductase/ring-hydroxylating ferredoxin subunit
MRPAASSPCATSASRGGAPCWTRACTLQDLAPGSLRTVKKGGAQLVLARTAAGDIHALDNRCPHEGYPLAQGTLSGTALTCCWHNWKFDVRDGACTLGGEDVRAYPVRVIDGEVEVDLAEPPPERSFAGWLASLEAGLERRDLGRALRDGVRLLQGGYPPWGLLVDVAAYDARHAEYGSGHALAVAADVGRSLGRYPGARAMFAIAPAIEMCAETNQRLGAHPAAEPIDGADGAALRAAIEAEDTSRALGLLAGAFAASVSRAEVEAWLYAALSDHFLSFGHPLIYLVKAQELLDRAGDERAHEIYAGLVRSIIYSTREDTLPYMAAYMRRLEQVLPELESVWSRADPGAAVDSAALQRAVLDGSNEEAFQAVWSALAAGVPAARVAEALVLAAAERLLRFDDAHERDPGVAENWLWATHRFTFASAVRNALERFDHPDALRFLFQAVMFIHSGRGMDLTPAERFERAEEDADLDSVLAAVSAREPRAAVCRGLGYLAAGGAAEELEAALLDACFAGRFVRPIVEAHGIKTTVAAFEEHAALAGDPERTLPIAAALRLVASPVTERNLHAQVRTSIAWVVDGKVPAKLTQ